MAKVLIIDQQPLICIGIDNALRKVGHVVTGVESNGLDGLKAFRSESPDLVILDIDIPRLGGLDVIKRITARKTNAGVLVLTGAPADVYEPLCVAAGASGFVSKSDSLEAFLDAVTKVLSGRTYFQAKALHADAGARTGAKDGHAEDLTAREVTVLHYLAEGYRVKQIAGELSISDRTVSTYKTRLLEKTGTHSLVELLQVASQRGFFEGKMSLTKSVSATPPAPETQFNDLLDQIPFPICLRAPDARILAANQALLQYLGVTRDQVLQSTHSDLGLIDKEHLEYAQKTFAAAVEQRIPYMMVVAINLRGKRRVVKHGGCPVLDADGNLVGMLCSSIDLDDEDRQIQSLREQFSYTSSILKRRSAYLLQQGEDITDNIASAKLIVNGRENGDYRGGLAVLLDRILENVEMVSELIRLELGEVTPIPYTEDLNEITGRVLTETLAHILPSWTLTKDPAHPHAWIDARPYANLLRAVLLHLRHEGAIAVAIQADSFERDAGHVDWRLVLKGKTAPHEESTKPVIYLSLASELSKLLHGHLRIVKDDDRNFEAMLTLTLPRATTHQTT